MIRRNQLSDAERGAWERAWQREYKRLTRGGASLEDAKREAREAARRVVELMRSGGQEPDFGRRRAAPESRGATSRERNQRRQIVVYLSAKSHAWIHAEALRTSRTASQIVDAIVCDRMRAARPRPEAPG